MAGGPAFAAAGPSEIQNAAALVRPVGAEGAWVGFDLIECASGRLIAPVRFSSNDMLFADRIAVERRDDRGVAVQTLAFNELRSRLGTGMTLGDHDWIKVTLRGDDPYPRIDFDVTVAGFTAGEWERFNGGPTPFHFLTLAMSEAEVWHQRGWLMATPKSDPFVLQQDVAFGGGSIASEFSRDWSYVCAMGGSPLPVIGLWAPSLRSYVGFEFQGTRVEDNTEREIAAAYCWQHGRDRQFVTLAAPHGSPKYRKLAYPPPKSAYDSHCTLVWNNDLPGTGDPNRWLHRLFAERYTAGLPRVSGTPNVGYLPGITRLKDWPSPPSPRLLVRREKDTTYAVAGTVEIGGWRWHAESPVEAAYMRYDAKAFAALREDLNYLMANATIFQAGGETCAFWEKPMEGCWRDKWGGEPVRSLHNANGFAAGIAMVDVWRHEHETNPEESARMLLFIDGIYNWARHFVWSRNEISDVPASPFAIGATLPAVFLLDYYFTFKNAPGRAERANAALDLALSVAYRYLVAWPCDNDRYDNDNPAFLMEPNSGEAWAGAPCANEVAWLLDTLAQVYVHTGDARLGYMVRGALDRWHLLYQEIEKPPLSACDLKSFTEGWGVYAGSGPGDGKRYEYGWADDLLYAWPFGDAVARVVCGERAALACVKTQEQFEVADYRSSSDGHFTFRVASDRKEPLDIALSYPQVNISARRVVIGRGGKWWDWSDNVRRPPQAPASLCLRGLRAGDVVVVGQPRPDMPPLAAARMLEQEKPPTDAVSLAAGPGDAGEFEMLPLTYDTQVECDWEKPGSWAGLLGGVRWAFGVPLLFGEPRLTGGRVARAAKVEFERAIDGPATLFLAYVPLHKDASFSLQFDKGVTGVASAEPAVAWRGWPPMFKKKVMIIPVNIPSNREVEAIVPSRALLLAATLHRGESKLIEPVMESLATGAEDWKKESKWATEMDALRAEAAQVPAGRIAVLPTSPGGPAGRFARQMGLLDKTDFLTPAQMVEPGVLDAKRYPVVLHLGGEHYPFSVHEDGDGRAALVNYLRSGGQIICAGFEPFPFYYADDIRDPRAPPRALPLLPELGVPMKSRFEKPPTGHTYRVDYASSQRIVPDLPWQVEFPTEGDQRLRAIDSNAVDDKYIRYQPIYSITDEHSDDYDDAAACIEWRAGELRGARLIYFWHRLFDLPDTGNQTLAGLFRYAIEQTKKAK